MASVRCWRRTPVTVVAWSSLVVLLLGLPATAPGQAAPSALKIVGPTKLTLDPVCNARTGVSLVSALRNDGSAPVMLALSATEPASKPAGKVALLKLAVNTLDTTNRVVTDRPSLAPGERVGIRVDLEGTVEAGDWEIEIRNAGTSVGTVAIVQLPFGVKLDVATPERAELLFERGVPTGIPLKNDDVVGYEVKGQYSVHGVVKDAQQPIYLSPNGGGGELTLIPPEQWFAPGIRTLFKDDTANGRLTVGAVSTNCPNDLKTPTRTFKTTATLAAWPASVKDYRGNWILLITLFLGGLCSLVLNFFLPAHGRRRRASAQLSEVARRIDDLPAQGDPQLFASLAVERRQLAERLRRLKFYDAQFSPGMTEIEKGLTRLCTRLDLLSQMDLVLNRYWRQRCVIVSDDIEELRRQLNALLRRSDPGDTDIQAAQALITKINELLTNANAANPELAARLVKDITTLKRDFDQAKGNPVGSSPVWKDLCRDLNEDFEEVTGASAPSDPAKIAPADYMRLGKLLFMAVQGVGFVKLCGATGPNGTLTDDQKELRKPLVRNLRGGSWDQLNRAQRMIQQVREEVSRLEIEDQISQGRVSVEPTRVVVRQFEPTTLRVTLLDKRLQGASLREEYTPSWEFEYANLKTKGWQVSHFFPLATGPEPQPSEPKAAKSPAVPAERGEEGEVFSKPYRINVVFIRDDGFLVPGKITMDIHVRPPLYVKVRASFWMEFLRFFLALGIATVGLFAGAREQILKLDVFPALIAVFLLGFGSDRIKNLFTQRGE
jgi:hypothetical protein